MTPEMTGRLAAHAFYDELEKIATAAAMLRTLSQAHRNPGMLRHAISRPGKNLATQMKRRTLSKKVRVVSPMPGTKMKVASKVGLLARLNPAGKLKNPISRKLSPDEVIRQVRSEGSVPWFSERSAVIRAAKKKKKELHDKMVSDAIKAQRGPSSSGASSAKLIGGGAALGAAGVIGGSAYLKNRNQNPYAGSYR
jgi:hypothetical protein